MKSHCSCLKGSEGGGLSPVGIKTIFFGIKDLTSQTLAVDGFCCFIEVFSRMSTHSLNHLKCAMESEGMQKPKNGNYQGARKKNQVALGTPTPTVCL